MKVGVLTVPLSSMPLKEALTYLKNLGVQTIELGCGGFSGTAHCNPAVLLADQGALAVFKQTIAQSGLEISALSCHANGVHPNAVVAAIADQTLENTILLANELGVAVVNTFSGCPGDSPQSQYPNWVTCPWPDDFGKILDYQWNDCLLPYWNKRAAFAKEHGVKIALEMHPGFCVYNTATMLRLRNEVGDALGANYDPSHLLWQGMDAVASIRTLAGAIYHVHAKDCKIDTINTGQKGVLDTVHYSDEINRSWIFRTIGYGNGMSLWKDIISTLRLVGYDGAVSIEHEDSLMSPKEGLEKAVHFLQKIIITQKSAEMWWA